MHIKLRHINSCASVHTCTCKGVEVETESIKQNAVGPGKRDKAATEHVNI